jgi:hypothetical protein
MQNIRSLKFALVNAIYFLHLPVVTYALLLVAAVRAIIVPVALPRAEDAFSGRAALEHVLWAVVGAVGLVAVVTAVVDAVADGGGEGAFAVGALELALAAHALGAGLGLVGTVLAVHFAVAPEE